MDNNCTEDGTDCSRAGILERMSGIVAPGKQWVMALKKRTLLTMELPTMRAVGENSSRGGELQLLGEYGEAEDGEGETATGSGAGGGKTAAWHRCELQCRVAGPGPVGVNGGS